MKKTYQQLTAGISAIILCISSSVCIVSADTMITQPYIPEGIEVAPPDNVDTTETVVDVDLNVICDSLREFATDKAAVFVAKKEGFVIFSSENQKEIDQAKAYCEENKIDSKYVFFILSEEELSGETIVTTPGYIPEGLPVADGTTQVDDETAALLNRICDELKENVYTVFENNENHDVRADLLLEHSYVIYESTDQAELDAAKKYCDEHKIAEYLVWLHFTGPVNTVIYTENDAEHGEHITDHSAIMEMFTEFISENNLRDVYLNDDKEFGKIIVDINPETEKEIRDFINTNKICYNETEVLVRESDLYEPITEELSLGDINSDGKVDLTDLSELSLAIIGDKTLTESQIKTADINKNGEADLPDLARLRQYLSKVITSLG